MSALGRVRRHCGDTAGARAGHEEMLGIARELGTTLWIADALSELGQDLVAAGELGEGERRLTEAIDAAREALQFTVRPRVALMELALRTGRPAEALDQWAQLPPSVAQFAIYALDARRVEAEALATLGRGDDAETRLRAVRADAATLGGIPAGWRASLALARLLDTAGRREEAQTARAVARRGLEKVAAGLTGAPDLLRGFKAGAAYREAFGP
jgi:tetratricopeptide (TPR) repeat protein